MILSDSKSISACVLDILPARFSSFFSPVLVRGAAAMPRVGQLRLGRAAPALCGARAASQPPRAAPGGHPRPRWPAWAARRCTREEFPDDDDHRAGRMQLALALAQRLLVRAQPHLCSNKPPSLPHFCVVCAILMPENRAKNPKNGHFSPCKKTCIKNEPGF